MGVLLTHDMDSVVHSINAINSMNALFTMNIRRAFKDDIGKLAEIEKQYPDYPAWGIKGLAAEFENKHSVTLVAEDDGGTRGFINFWIFPPTVQLNAVIVDSGNLRSGIASGLLKKLFEYAKKNSCEEIDLEVNFKNGAAVSFYKKSGFKETGRRLKFYNNNDDAVLMKFQFNRA